MIRLFYRHFSEMLEPPYYINYSPTRATVHSVVTSKYFDLAISAVIGLNVITMAMEFYMMPNVNIKSLHVLIHNKLHSALPGIFQILATALRVFNYFFTAVFILESAFKVTALGFERYLNDKWNQLDVVIVFLSIVGIVLEELESEEFLPINPTILRVMRVMRIARGTKHVTFNLAY